MAEPSKGAKIALVVFTATVATLVGAIVVGGLAWVAQAVWSAVL